MRPEHVALLCDLDGTLVDSRPEVDAAWRAFAALHGLDVDAVLAATFAGPSREVVRTVAPWLDAEAEAARVEGLQVDTAARTRAIDGAADLPAPAHVIEKLKESSEVEATP